MPRRPATKRFTASNLAGARALLYARCSSDDKRTEKSVEDQETVGRRWLDRLGAKLGAVVVDNDQSASEYRQQDRTNWPRVLKAIEDDQIDLVWFWSYSRCSRDLVEFIPFRELVRKHHVLLAFKDRAYDMNVASDRDHATHEIARAEAEAGTTSDNVTMGKEESAHKGRPAGRVAFGYKRFWTTNEKGETERIRDEEHPVEGPIVREIFDRVASGEPIQRIRRDLRDRGVTTRSGRPLSGSLIHDIALNPTYIAARTYRVADHDIRNGDRTKAILPGVVGDWPALVTEETFWRCHAILADPSRWRTRTGPRPKTLVGAIATCGECGGTLTGGSGQYACLDRQCVGIPKKDLDAWVESTIVEWLADPDVAADLAQSEAGNTTAAAAQARDDLERARKDLRQLNAKVDTERVDLDLATRQKRLILADIEDAEQRIKELTLPPALLGCIGPHAQKEWDALDIDQRRAIVAEVADIKVLKVGRGGPGIPAAERVEWRWRLGPNAGQWIPAQGHDCRVCGAPMQPGERGWSRYCSPECHQTAKRVRHNELRAIRRAQTPAERPMAKCELCGEPFPLTRRVRRFCSEHCRAVDSNRRQRERERAAKAGQRS
jgi:DNA invertase Pin-like site-specific DNA recombinase/predicted nucleic acid-binding Zn ribbon protein